MFHHLTHVFELPLMNFMRLMQRVVIKGKTDGQVDGPLNIEKPTLVQKRKLKKINDYGIIISIGVPYLIFGIFIIQ